MIPSRRGEVPDPAACYLLATKLVVQSEDAAYGSPKLAARMLAEAQVYATLATADPAVARAAQHIHQQKEST